jgi:hypothetical protein
MDVASTVRYVVFQNEECSAYSSFKGDGRDGLVIATRYGPV